MLKKITLVITVFIVCGGTLVFGQDSRSLPFLELNADTRTAGMGDAGMGETTTMYLYTNPTAFFQNQNNLFASYTLGIYPKIDDHRRMYHATSAGYKLLDKHALMVGFRYMSGLEVPRIGEDGIEHNPIKPMDWSIDFAYAFNFNTCLSAYIGGNVIQSYNSETAHSASLSAGAYYRNSLRLSAIEGHYALGLSLYDLGTKIKYTDNGPKNHLPTSVGLGGTLAVPLNENHKVSAALSTRYFILPSDASAFTGGIGAEYEMRGMVAVRAGYHWGDSNGYATMGLGCKIKMVNIDAAYMIAKTKDYNMLRLGISVQL